MPEYFLFSQKRESILLLFHHSQAYYYVGLLYLYVEGRNKTPETALKCFNLAISRNPLALYNAHPSLYYLSQLKGAEFLGKRVLRPAIYHNGCWGVERKGFEGYEIRKYKLKSGQTLSVLFDLRGRFQTVIPGEVVALTYDRLVVNYQIKSKKNPIGFNVEFPSPREVVDYNERMIRAIIEMPADLFKGLKTVFVSDASFKLSGLKLKAAGYYKLDNESISIYSARGGEAFSHELFHHFEIFNMSSALRKLYDQISWSIKKGKRELHDYDQRDFARLGECFDSGIPKPSKSKGGQTMLRKGCSGQKIPYGMSNNLEDFAAFGEEYYNRGDGLRNYIREQIKQKNFEPAVKYLFFKYVVFGGAEFQLGIKYGTDMKKPKIWIGERKLDRGLSIQEVKVVIDTYRDTIRGTTLETFDYLYGLALHPRAK